MFGGSIESIIIKYTLGACFVVLFVSFGVKMVMLLGTVAKLKLLGVLESHELLLKIFKAVSAK